MRKRSKESKSLEIFKKGFRKNEVVIYAIALMLVTAGYFNYTANIENNSLETYSKDAQNIAKDEKSTVQTSQQEEGDISVSVEEKEEQNNTIAVAANNENNPNSKEDNEDDIGDAKLVNSNDVVNDSENNNESEDKDDEKTDTDSDYFVSSKLERDTNYADMISTYTKIVEDSSVSETQKAIAMKEIKKITDTKNAISVCENILSTKGFENYIVLVNNDSTNVVVQVKDGLTKEKVAQIQNIVSRELNSKIENIHITEKQ